jgi:AraC-like DNA-binding protein
LSRLGKLTIGLFVASHIVYFGILDGRGILHDFIHALFLILFGHLLIKAIVGLRDDLLEPRRRFRVFTIAFVSLQFSLITIGELVDPAIGDLPGFTAANAVLLFVVITAVGVHLLGATPSPILGKSVETTLDEPDIEKVPGRDKRLYEALVDLMNSGGYRTSNLVISQLARRLSVPEYRLRRLINRHLGFRNFSSFLNGYRVREACKRLSDPTQAHIPVLTIALELGYGSIGPFNRAFKEATGLTPSEFRRRSGEGVVEQPGAPV